MQQFRLLNAGDIVKDGDEEYVNQRWRPVAAEFINTAVQEGGDPPVRRALSSEQQLVAEVMQYVYENTESWAVADYRDATCFEIGTVLAYLVYGIVSGRGSEIRRSDRGCVVHMLRKNKKLWRKLQPYITEVL